MVCDRLLSKHFSRSHLFNLHSSLIRVDTIINVLLEAQGHGEIRQLSGCHLAAQEYDFNLRRLASSSVFQN